MHSAAFVSFYIIELPQRAAARDQNNRLVGGIILDIRTTHFGWQTAVCHFDESRANLHNSRHSPSKPAIKQSWVVSIAGNEYVSNPVCAHAYQVRRYC
jgi:hypothetical protein